METLALAIRHDGEAEIAQRLAPLKDVNWVSIPYCRPGLPLYRGIIARQKPDTNVLVLRNHGLVVGGASVAEVEDRMARVCAALSAPARPAPQADLAALARLTEGTGYRLPAFDDVHSLALDPLALAYAKNGSLYPDHVIFLGPGVVEAADIATGAAVELPGWTKGAPPMLILPQGVVLRSDMPPAADAMAKCLSDVLSRVPPGCTLTRLTPAQDYELTNWEAEKYRQSLNISA